MAYDGGLGNTFNDGSTLFQEAITTGRPGNGGDENISVENLFMRDVDKIKGCLEPTKKAELVRKIKNALRKDGKEEKQALIKEVFVELWISLNTGYTKAEIERVVNNLIEKFESSYVVPIEPIGKTNDYLLNESLGPTDAFKDLALQMLTEMVAIIVEKYNEEQVEYAKALKGPNEDLFEQWKGEDRNEEKNIGDYYDDHEILRPKLKFIITQTSTSGDTGPAGQDGILGKNFIINAVGYPQGEATYAQRGQMQERSKKNVRAFPLSGQFSKIQEIMNNSKPEDWDEQIQAIIEEELREIIDEYGFEIEVDSGSFNSVNPGRIDGQMNYHAFGLMQAEANNLLDENNEIIEVVPSGNGGHVFGILMAREMIGIKGPTVITTNENDLFYQIINEGRFQKPPDGSSVHQPSASMIIEYPNNMWRLFSYAFGKERANNIAKDFMNGKEVVLDASEMKILKEDLQLYCVKTDAEGELTSIYNTFKNHKRLTCPHTANAYHGIQELRSEPGFGSQYADTKSLISETASPWKFLAANAAGLIDENDLNGRTRVSYYEEFRKMERSPEGCQRLIGMIKKAYKREEIKFEEEFIPENLRKIFAEGFHEPDAKSADTFHEDTLAFLKEYAPMFKQQVEKLLAA